MTSIPVYIQMGGAFRRSGTINWWRSGDTITEFRGAVASRRWRFSLLSVSRDTKRHWDVKSKKRHRRRGEHIQRLLWEPASHAIMHIIITKIIKQVNILHRVIHTMLALDVCDSNITKLSNLQISRIIRENNHHHHSKNLIVQSSTFPWTVKSRLKPSRRTQQVKSRRISKTAPLEFC